MGQAVAQRTVLRKKSGTYESWGDVASRVAIGNALLLPEQMQSKPSEFGLQAEYEALSRHIAKGTILMSGRHLQHGDETQPIRNMEVLTNCSTSVTSFALFMLLLNGSGVGRSYDDDLTLVNWDYAPHLRCVISSDHADFVWGQDEDVREARHKYRGSRVIWHEVEDSREGWAKAVEVWKTLAFEKINSDKTLVLDFSKVRPKGAPIGGMQGRPSSGPKPLMAALAKCETIRGSGMDPWLQSLYIDHYLAECVLVGGARRAARMATKWWEDEGIIDFIRIKRPVEYDGLSMEEVIALRAERTKQALFPLQAFLWSANNSVMVDAAFWQYVEEARQLHLQGKGLSSMSRKQRHAWKVWQALTEAAYADGTGEPGIINGDQLVSKNEGWEAVARGDYVGSHKYQVEDDTRVYLAKAARAAMGKSINMIVNPCGRTMWKWPSQERSHWHQRCGYGYPEALQPVRDMQPVAPSRGLHFRQYKRTCLCMAPFALPEAAHSDVQPCSEC